MHPRRFGFLVFCARIVAGPAGLYPLANFECSGRSDVLSCVWTAFIGRLMAAWAAHLHCVLRTPHFQKGDDMFVCVFIFVVFRLHPRRFGFLVFCAIIVAGPAGLYPLANFECIHGVLDF